MSALGEEMFGWAIKHVERASGRGDKVIVIGHIPPYQSQWVPGRYRQWILALTPYYRRVSFVGRSSFRPMFSRETTDRQI